MITYNLQWLSRISLTIVGKTIRQLPLSHGYSSANTPVCTTVCICVEQLDFHPLYLYIWLCEVFFKKKKLKSDLSIVSYQKDNEVTWNGTFVVHFRLPLFIVYGSIMINTVWICVCVEAGAALSLGPMDEWVLVFGTKEWVAVCSDRQKWWWKTCPPAFWWPPHLPSADCLLLPFPSILSPCLFWMATEKIVHR